MKRSVWCGVILASLSGPARASIGLAESERYYKYTDAAELWSGHADLCDDFPHKNCLSFSPNLRHLFDQVSMPPSPSTPVALVHAPGSQPTPWLIIDLATNSVLSSSKTKDEAAELWRQQVHSTPELVAVEQVDSRFSETFASLKMRYLWVLLVWSPYLVSLAVFFAALTFLGWIMRKAYNKIRAINL